jgi:CRISPR-associated protein Csm5
MTQHNIHVTLISPLHIGSGEELRADFDYIVSQGRTYRLNQDAILGDFQDRLTPDSYGRYPTLGQLLRTNQALKNAAYYRYTLKGTPRSGKVDARIQACIKDVHDHPYLPGSSLKGALRTALAWTGWQEMDLKVLPHKLGRRRFWAGQKLEREIFGQNPNLDLLRALQVSDCFSEKAHKRLVVANAQVLTKRDLGSPVELEAISGDTVFSGTIKIDDFLFSKQAESKLHFADRRQWLSELMVRVQKHSHARIAAMLSWFQDVEHGEKIAGFLRQLVDFSPGPDQALMQIGWGTGWDGKTFWTHLKQDEYTFEKILKDYRMVRKGKRSLGDPFPKSRRVVMQGKESDIPLAPFGWALVEMESKRA